MDYNLPVNTPDGNDNPRLPFWDGNPAAGLKGAIPPGKAIGDPQAEIVNAIEMAGLTPDANDLTQLYQAIAAMIAAAGGGGGGGSPATFTYNPVFPEILTGGGFFTITATTGEVQIPTGQTHTFRGGTLFNTADVDSADRTFSTTASKTYHLRWRYNGGTPVFVLKDLADAGYNPGALAESDAAFDSTFDDMLIARVQTDGANTPTVTALKNKHALKFAERREDRLDYAVNPTVLADSGEVINWARRPAMPIIAIQAIQSWGPSNDYRAHNLRQFGFEATGWDRYALADLQYKYRDSENGTNGEVIYTLTLEA